MLVPTQLTHLAHDGLIQFSRLFFKVATSLNAELSSFAIVPIQIDIRTHIQQIVLAKLLLDFGAQRVFRAIRSDVALAEAFGEGGPVRSYRSTSRGAGRLRSVGAGRSAVLVGLTQAVARALRLSRPCADYDRKLRPVGLA